MNQLKENNKLIEKENQNKLRDLENFYTNSKIDNIQDVLNKRKELLVNKITEFQKQRQVENVDNNGNKTIVIKDLNPIVISNYFFKSINPISSSIPEYNAEKLGVLYDYYLYILTEVNDKIGYYPPSLSSFCKLGGISLNTLRNYRNSDDLYMREVVEKIYDQIGDENLTMAQLSIVKERSTMFKMRSQNELMEKQQPNINITYKEVVNKNEIESKINRYQSFIDKKDRSINGEISEK